MTGSRKLPRVLAAIAVAGAAAAAGTIGLAAAQTDTTSPSTTAPSSSTTAPVKGEGHRGGPGGRFGFGFGGDVLHGEFVVPKDGGYETLDTQVGKVTAVSDSSITVVSDDGFSKTYAVTADTLVNSARDGIGSIKNDATVRITATVSGSTATAVNIIDTSTIEAQRPKWAPDHRQAPAASSPTTTTG
jgi:hypothetical protein